MCWRTFEIPSESWRTKSTSRLQESEDVSKEMLPSGDLSTPASWCQETESVRTARFHWWWNSAEDVSSSQQSVEEIFKSERFAIMATRCRCSLAPLAAERETVEKHWRYEREKRRGEMHIIADMCVPQENNTMFSGWYLAAGTGSGIIKWIK